MKSKKAELTDHVLGIIVAVVCLVLLGGLVVLVYKNFATSEYTSAKKVLDFIEVKINAINAGESTQFSIQSPCKAEKIKDGSCDWQLIGWGKDDVGRPDRCYFNSCVCVCAFNEGNIEEYKNKCQDSKTGICKKIDTDKISVVNSYNTDLLKNPAITIRMDKPLIELLLSKSNNMLSITNKE